MEDPVRMKQDKFTSRYVIKLSSSVVIAALNIAVQLLLPRALSTDDYGYFSYNLNMFTSAVVMANLSTSNAMVAKFSKRNEELGIVDFYLGFFAIVAVVLNIGVSVLLYTVPSIREGFGGQALTTVLLALCGCIVNKLLMDTISMYDASAISRFPAIMQMAMKVVFSVCVIGGYALHILSLQKFYIFQVIVVGGTVLLLLISFRRDNRKRYPVYRSNGAGAYIKEYYVYCKPLVFATIISQLMIMIMNHALMTYSGATEQAMFGAAWQLNALVAYVFSPYAELMKREFAAIVNDRDMLRDRFRQSIRLMLFVTSYFAIFLAICAKWVLPIVYGNKYMGAILVTQLMMYYTVYQAMGQVTGAYFIATEKTRQQAVFTIICQALTLIAVFIFQIPNFIWPEGLGSTGIALNYLTVNIISVVLMVGYIIRGYGLSAIKENLMALPVIAVLSAVALIFREIFKMIPGENMMMLLVKVFLTGICYTAAAAVFVWICPNLTIAATRDALKEKAGAVLKKFRK